MGAVGCILLFIAGGLFGFVMAGLMVAASIDDRNRERKEDTKI